MFSNPELIVGLAFSAQHRKEEVHDGSYQIRSSSEKRISLTDNDESPSFSGAESNRK
jgi:hypothetical protein